MTSLATAILVFVSFLLGCVLGRFERADRRITHEAPRTIDLTIQRDRRDQQRIRQWHGERLVREVGNRRR